MISQEAPKKLFLLDAYALIFRAYYAFIRNPRINSKGLNTSAMFGFTNVLLDIIRNEKPSHLAVVFDSHETTFREEAYADYKANRDETPEDIKLAVPYIFRIIEAMNIPIYQVGGFEADDVIGTLAKMSEKEGFVTYMMTSDKDYGQLVSDYIFIYKPGYQGGSAEILGQKEVCEKFNIDRVEQVIDLLGMMGDAVDNIPGIPGVGEKTAAKLLKEFGSLEGLLANTDKLKGKQKENVENFRDQAILSKELATIHLGAPVEWNEDRMRVRLPDEQKIKDVFEELEFRTLLKRVLGDAAPLGELVQGNLFPETKETKEKEIQPKLTIDQVPHQYHLVEESAAIDELVETLIKSQYFSFDTETDAIDAIDANLVGFSFSVSPGNGWYIPVPQDFNEAKEILQRFQNVFADTSKTLIAQNYKFDYKILLKYGIAVNNKIFDTMLAHYIISPDSKHGMDYLSELYLNYTPVSIETLIGKKGKNQGTMADLTPAQICDYAAEDADVTLQLYHKLEPELSAGRLSEVLHQVELPLVEVLADMELEGVRIDKEFLLSYSKELEEEIYKLESAIHSAAGEIFNIDSPKQLGVVLFEKMKISDQVKKTAGGQYSTSEDVLAKFAHSHPIVDLILSYRELRKLKSTYVDALPGMIHPKTGRVHTNYMQSVAATGRLSSNNPNLQNIPIRTARGKEVRRAFIAKDEHHTIVSADYSQVELRIIAALSGDENMCAAFLAGEDIHRATAAKVFGVEEKDVTKEMRSKAKAVNFGIIYGQGAFGLSQNLGISRTEAKEIIDSYFKQFGGLKQYQHSGIENARKLGYVETLMGRRRYLPDINSANAVVRGFAERNAINAPIQGTAADIIKKAMIDIHAEMKGRQMRSRMVMQVHDELVFDAHKDELDTLKDLIQRRMTQAVAMRVPLEVEIDQGPNWLEAH